MRVRLQLLLPLAVALLIAAAFMAAALTVGDAVRLSRPGFRAEAAARIVVLWGVAAVVAGAVLGAWIARLVIAPLRRMRAAAGLMGEESAGQESPSRLTEIQDIVRDMHRSAAELRERHTQELRERSELATLVQAVSEGILQVDEDGRITRLNRAARTLLGFPEDAPGRLAASLVRNLELRRLLDRSASSGGVESSEVTLDDRRILLSSTPMPDGGAVLSVVDLTDLRRLEEVRRDFVANASHELKTPLTSIRGYAETLLGGDLPPGEQRQFLATIGRNAERLQRIVDDLLDLSRLESGRWQPELTPVDVAAVARIAWQPLGERAASSQVTLEVQAPAREAFGRADRRALDQVFTNLYDNALRHTPAEGRITVRVRHEQGEGAGASKGPQRMAGPPGNGKWLVVEVSDTGGGIPRDALPRVFERFYRVDPARSRAEGGTGLGLSIVKHMIESMGGGVAAESELGKGTTIRFWLPAAG